MIVETWLRTNVRAVWLGMLPPLVVGLVGLALAVGLPGFEPGSATRIVGTVLAVLAAIVLVALAWQLRVPRLAYSQGHLLFRLRSGPPIRVPIEAVECFWLGQAPSLLPGKRHERVETAALVARIADKATEWHHQDVKPQLGKWCEGYVTIRGTWCEPLGIELVNRLNQRLADVTSMASGGASKA